MSDVRRRPQQLGPRKDQKQDKAGREGVVPVIPEWLKEWGLFILVPATLAAFAVVVAIGRAHGAAEGWTLAFAFASVAAVLWWFGFTRRRRASEAQRYQALREELEIAIVDQMTWQEFEDHCARVLRALGYRSVAKTRGVSREKAVDITAIAPDSTAVAAECKHWKNRVGVREVRNLITAVNTGLYKGRAGILMTSTQVTVEARDIAAEGQITVVDRAALQKWTVEAVSRIEHNQASQTPDPSSQSVKGAGGRHSPAGLVARRLQVMSGAAKFTTAVLCCAGTAMSLVAVQVATSTPRPWVPTGHTSRRIPMSRSFSPVSSLSAVPAPSTVVREFFAAISRHDWPEVWQLGGKNLGRGSYASYNGMISGYQSTIRDVLITLRAAGEYVSGQFLAFETAGVVKTYQFSYMVHGREVVTGYQHVVRTGHQRAAGSDS